MYYWFFNDQKKGNEEFLLVDLQQGSRLDLFSRSL